MAKKQQKPDPKNQGGRTVEEITRRQNAAFQVSLQERKQALLSYAFTRGTHNVKAADNGWAVIDHKYRANTQFEPIPVQRNRYGRAVRDLCGKFSRPLVFEATARSADDVAREAAHRTQAVANDYAHRHRFDDHNKRFVFDAVNGGTAVLIYMWDADAKDAGVITDPDTGEDLPVGDIRVFTANVTQIAVQPGVENGAAAEWMVWVRRIPVDEAMRVFGLEKRPAAVSPANTPVTSAKSRATTDETCELVTYMERPVGDRKGGVWSIIDGSIVDHAAWNYGYDHELPIEIGIVHSQEETWLGYTPLWDAIDPQVDANEALTRIRDLIDRAGDSVEYYPAGTSPDFLEAAPGRVAMALVDGRPGKVEPSVIDAELVRYYQEALLAIDDAANITEVDRGSAPKGVIAKGAIENLIGQSIQSKTVYTQMIANTWGRFMSKILVTLSTMVTEPRKATVRENDLFTTEIEWDGKLLAKHTTVTVPEDAVVPKTLAGQRAVANDLWDKGIIDTPEEYAAAEGTPSPQWLSVKSPHWACANEENHLMWAGHPVVPEEIDDHEVHLRALTTFMTSRRFRDLPCPIEWEVAESGARIAHCKNPKHRDGSGQPCKAIYYVHQAAHVRLLTQSVGEMAWNAEEPGLGQVIASVPNGETIPDSVREALGALTPVETEEEQQEAAAGEAAAAEVGLGAATGLA
jgi:hypothetical protein